MKLHNEDLGPFRVFGPDFDDEGHEFEKGYAQNYGIELPHPEKGGVTLFVPWGRIDRIEAGAEDRAAAADPARYDVEDPDAEGTDHTDTSKPLDGAVTPPAGAETPDSGEKAEPAAKDDKAGQAREWKDADPADVRAWAQQQGLDVKDSGTIPKAVLSKYQAAHSD